MKQNFTNFSYIRYNTIFADVCVYKGVPYTQGQQWYDGCDKVCICENGMTGYIRCRQRCTTYDTIAAGCTMVPDPKDPVCCQV